MNNAGERELIMGFLKTGSESLFREIYRKYTASLYRTALGVLNHNVHGAEDVVQETWIRAIKNFQQFRWESSLNTWLTRITINCCRDYQRKNSRVHGELEELADTAASPRKSEDRIDLKMALSQLPPGYKEVFLLHELEGYKHEEIAMILGINEGTSKSQLSHARKAIKKLMV